MMKRLLSAIASMLLVMSAHSEVLVAPEYVSIDCHIGDISLRLKGDHTYVLELKHWDGKTLTYTKTETLSGTWSYIADVLILKSQSSITYRRSKASLKIGAQGGEIDSFAWQSSSSPVFADSYMLVEKVAVDKLLMSAIPYNPA